MALAARSLAAAAGLVALLAVVACGSSGTPDGTTSEDSVPGGELGVGEGDATTSTTVDPALACVRQMPLRERAAQTMAIAIDGGLLAAAASRVAELGVGAVILQRPAATGRPEGIAEVKAASRIPPLVMVDEEGGQSQVLRNVVGPFPGQPQMAAGGDPAAVQQQLADHAAAVAAIGVDVVMGPVVDVALPGGGGPVGERSFSDDPAVVTAFGQTYVDTYLAAGILPVLKHFPGHGAASGDSHDGPVSVPGIAELQARDLVPYEELLATPGVAVMVAHVVVPDLTGFTASSMSAEVTTGLLQDQLGFDGLVMTDSMSMGAIAFRTPPEISLPAAIAAGADLALFVTIQDPAAAITALEQAVTSGEVPEERLDDAVAQVLAAKQIDPCTLTTLAAP